MDVLRHAFPVGTAGSGGVGRGYGRISLVSMSLRGGECSVRGRRVSLAKCWVSRLLERAWRAKRMLARAGEEVWNVRR